MNEVEQDVEEGDRRKEEDRGASRRQNSESKSKRNEEKQQSGMKNSKILNQSHFHSRETERETAAWLSSGGSSCLSSNNDVQCSFSWLEVAQEIVDDRGVEKWQNSGSLR